LLPEHANDANAMIAMQPSIFRWFIPQQHTHLSRE
jgi:hypothetical protein